MKSSTVVGITLIALLSTSPACAMDHYGTIVPDTKRAAIHDPDERLEQLAAAASQPRGNGHDKPPTGLLSIMRDDAELKRAFTWLGAR